MLPTVPEILPPTHFINSSHHSVKVDYERGDPDCRIISVNRGDHTITLVCPLYSGSKRSVSPVNLGKLRRAVLGTVEEDRESVCYMRDTDVKLQVFRQRTQNVAKLPIERSLLDYVRAPAKQVEILWTAIFDVSYIFGG